MCLVFPRRSRFSIDWNFPISWSRRWIFLTASISVRRCPRPRRSVCPKRTVLRRTTSLRHRARSPCSIGSLLRSVKRLLQHCSKSQDSFSWRTWRSMTSSVDVFTWSMRFVLAWSFSLMVVRSVYRGIAQVDEWRDRRSVEEDLQSRIETHEWHRRTLRSSANWIGQRSTSATRTERLCGGETSLTRDRPVRISVRCSIWSVNGNASVRTWAINAIGRWSKTSPAFTRRISVRSANVTGSWWTSRRRFASPNKISSINCIEDSSDTLFSLLPHNERSLLRNLMLLQRHLVDYDAKQSLYIHKLNRTRKTMSFLRQLNQTPSLYSSFLSECLRRKEYSKIFNEVRRRTKIRISRDSSSFSSPKSFSEKCENSSRRNWRSANSSSNSSVRSEDRRKRKDRLL